jgi:hypothetical protein
MGNRALICGVAVQSVAAEMARIVRAHGDEA